MKNNISNTGFSLLEVVFCLLLMGIIGSIWGLGLVNILNGFIQSKQNTEILQKGQMAMTRIIKEFQDIDSIISSPAAFAPTNKYIQFKRNSDGTTHILNFDGTDLKIDNEILADNINSFNLHYYTKFDSIASAYTPLQTAETDPLPTTMIDIILELKGFDNIISKFNTRVYLRGR